ncbi:MAG: hypothetical protein ACYDCG_14100 [Candidatus Acidiferrales bacterium]
MGAHLPRIFCLALAGFFLFQPGAASSQKKPKHPKKLEAKVENYFGGVFLVGDGGIPNGPCFRINGRVTSGNFFDQLKSYGTDDGTTFRLGTTEVTKFPDNILLTLLIHDQPCSYGLQPVGTGVYLTQQTMSSLKLSLYWKHGVDMRPAEKITLLHFSVDPLDTYTDTLATDLPKRYLWSYEFAIPSAGVPLTDSLVLVIRSTNGQMAARVAARL